MNSNLKSPAGIPVIAGTRNYDLFENKLPGNRKTSKAHISRLIEAFKTDASCIKYNPILINESFQIIDGQHRFAAIKEIGEIVYYIQVPGLTLKNAQALNSLTRVWSPMDYAMSYSNLGNEDYKDYLTFRRIYKLNHDILLKFLALDEPMTKVMFETGMFKITDRQKTIDLCNCLQEVGKYYDRYKFRGFAFAFMEIFFHPNYSQKRMVEKLKENPDVILDCATPKEYIDQLLNLYNKGLSEDKRIVLA